MEKVGNLDIVHIAQTLGIWICPKFYKPYSL